MTKSGIETQIALFSLKGLMAFHKPGEIAGYCANCPRYGLYWSCPPHDFSLFDYLGSFTHAAVIGTKFFLPAELSRPDQLALYHEKKREINTYLLDNELLFADSEILISGHCSFCGSCTREVGKICPFPEKQRFSLESLGFKLSDIIKEHFHDSLQWKKTETPGYLYIVSGMLSKHEIARKDLLNLF